MLKMIIVTLFLVLYPTDIDIDESRIGYAPFAIAHPKFNCSAFLNSIDKQKVINISWLYNTFGNDYRCLDQILSDKRLNYIQTHLLNGPGHRNKRLEKHEFLQKYSVAQWNSLLIRNNPVIKRKFLRYIKGLQKVLAHKRNTTTCLISPELEANISIKAAKTLIAWSREAFPQCLIVWNPLKRSATRLRTADFIEQHGKDPIVKYPCITNLDGTDISFPERIAEAKKYYRRGEKNWIESSNLKKYIQKYTAICEISFIWVSEYNCVDNHRRFGIFTSPTKRTCKQNTFTLVEREVEKF